MHTGTPDTFAHVVIGFRRGLTEFGLIEGRHFLIEFRWAQGRYDQLPSLAADLVARRVSVIAATGGTASGLAAKATTTTIPVVFTTGGDPVKFGLVTSLNRPTDNVTGVNVVTTELEAKRLGLLRELGIRAVRIGFLVNPSNPDARVQLEAMQTAALAVGQNIVVANASSDSDFELAYENLQKNGVSAVLVGNDAFFQSSRTQLVALSARYALPAIYAYREFVMAGGLMSYSANLPEAYRQAGVYVGRILRAKSRPVCQSCNPVSLNLSSI